MSYLVNEQQQKAAFGETLVAEITPTARLEFPYNINTDIVTTATGGSGTVAQSDSKAVLQTSSGSSSSANLYSKRVLKYDPGQGGLVRFTSVFTTGSANSSQEIGYGDATDGLFFGYNGTALGILRRVGGADTWVAQASWNMDEADGTGALPSMTWTKGNVFQIRFQWLGFGQISFWVENPDNGRFVCVHEIRYANTSTIPSLLNPSLPLWAKVANTSNDTNIQLQISSMMGGVEGRVFDLGTENSKSNSKAGVSTETNILTIRNKSTYAGITNRVRISPKLLTIATDGTKIVTVRIVKNTTLGGAPSYTDISTNTSVVDYDTDGTTLTGGTELLSIQMGKLDSDKVDLSHLLDQLNPGDTLTISATSSSSTEAGVSIVWRELF